MIPTRIRRQSKESSHWKSTTWQLFTTSLNIKLGTKRFQSFRKSKRTNRREWAQPMGHSNQTRPMDSWTPKRSSFPRKVALLMGRTFSLQPKCIKMIKASRAWELTTNQRNRGTSSWKRAVELWLRLARYPAQMFPIRSWATLECHIIPRQTTHRRQLSDFIVPKIKISWKTHRLENIS